MATPRRFASFYLSATRLFSLQSSVAVSFQLTTQVRGLFPGVSTSTSPPRRQTPAYHHIPSCFRITSLSFFELLRCGCSAAQRSPSQLAPRLFLCTILGRSYWLLLRPSPFEQALIAACRASLFLPGYLYLSIVSSISRLWLEESIYIPAAQKHFSAYPALDIPRVHYHSLDSFPSLSFARPCNINILSPRQVSWLQVFITLSSRFAYHLVHLSR